MAELISTPQNGRSPCRAGGIAHPVLMSVTHDDKEYVAVFIDPIDNKMSLEQMNAHRRRQLSALARHARVAGNQVKNREQLIMIPSGLCRPEQAQALFRQADNI